MLGGRAGCGGGAGGGGGGGDAAGAGDTAETASGAGDTGAGGAEDRVFRKGSHKCKSSVTVCHTPCMHHPFTPRF